MVHHLELEVDGRLLKLKLPSYLPLEMVADLTDYLGTVMGGFPVQKGQEIHLLAGGLELVGPELDEVELMSIVDQVYRHVNCWFACYPRRLEEMASKKKRLQLVR